MAESVGEGSSKDVPAPPKKRSLFGNSAWSKPQESEEGIDFFSRAKELYPMRVAEEERKLQRKLAKQRQERRRSTASAERKASSTPEVKRQRLSSEAQEGGDNSSDNSPSRQLLDDIFSSHEKPLDTPPTDYITRTRSQGSPTVLAARNTRSLLNKAEEATTQRSGPENPISLSDSEDGERGKKSTRNAAAQPINLDDDDDIYPVRPITAQVEEEDPQLSDEEFPELVQRAREREKQKELERLSAAKALGESDLATKAAVSGIEDVFQDSSAPEVDPVVEILVTSWIEGTNPLLVRRRLNQRLKEVKLGWCDKQVVNGAPLPPQYRAAIFLTWNGKRLFDASTCKHLGIKMGRDGRFASEGEGFDDNGRLHFEAWTEELFAAYQNAAQLQQEGGDDQEDIEQTQEPAGRIRLVLIGKDMEPFRLRVKPTTSVRKMCQAFRQDKDLSDEKEIALYFDGDKLDPDLRVEDSELADLDRIEVHIR